MAWVRVATTDQIPEGRGLHVVAEGREIAVFRAGDRFYAVEGFCPHRGGPIAEGELDGETVTCPWHGWSFSLRTGLCTFNPKAALGCFEIRREGDEILLRVQADTG